MRLLPLFLLASAALLAIECDGPVSLCESRLEILAYAGTDQPLANFSATLTAGSFSRAVKSGQMVPYGEYLLRVNAPGFRSVTAPLHIDTPETLVRVELEIGAIAGGHRASIIRGQIQKLPAHQEIWAKAIPLRGPGSTESRVYGSGYFELRGLRRGRYILLLTTADRVLHQQIVQSQEPGRDSPILPIRLAP